MGLNGFEIGCGEEFEVEVGGEAGGGGEVDDVFFVACQGYPTDHSVCRQIGVSAVSWSYHVRLSFWR